MNEREILGAWRPDSESMAALAEGTEPNIEREQFAQAMDIPMVEVMNLLEDCYHEHEHKKVLVFLEYFSDQSNGHLEMIATEKHGTVLAFVR